MKNRIRLFIFLVLATLSMPTFAVTAVIAAAAYIGSFVAANAATVIAIGMAVASYAYAKSIKIPKSSRSQSEIKQMLRSTRAPKQVVHGKTLMSGALIFAEEQVGDEENDEGLYDEWLYMAVGMCDHEISQVHELYLNETPETDFGSNVVYKVNNNETEVDEYMLNNAPSWEADMIGKGVMWLRLGLLFNRDKFANGVPTPRLEVSGRAILDPRDGVTRYSNNAALVIMDYFTTYRNVPMERIITSGFGSFIDAANLCDEDVINADGTTSKRYTINGVWMQDEKPSEVLSAMLLACGGQLVRIGGKIGILPAAYYGPASFTITESDIVGDISIQPQPSYGDAVNTIKGTFVDPAQNYVETDFPSIADEGAIVRDGGEIAQDLQLKFVTDVYQAQRLAAITLKRSLAGGSVTMKLNLKGLYCRTGRVIKLDLPTIGLIGEYRVTRMGNHISDGVEISLVRDDITIYDDAVGEPFTPPPLVNLPVGGTLAPSAIQFLVEQVGEVVQGTITWRINEPQSASSDIRIKRFSDNAVVLVGQSNRNSFKVNGLPADNYIVEVRTVTMRGDISNWTSSSFVIDLPPQPDSVTISTSNWNVQLIPVVDGGIPAGTLFEFRYLADDASFLTQPPTYGAGDILLSESVFTGSTFTQGGLVPDRWQHYWVRGVNSYGQSDWIYVQAGTTKEQDLVTTVVERLEAIEIVSSNYVEGVSGYKLFGPNSADPSDNGKAEFNSVIVRGAIYANSLTFTQGAEIPPEIDNSKVVTNKTYRQDEPPTENLNIGDLWFDTDNGNKEYRYNGSVWESVVDGDIAKAIQDAADAQATADGKIETFFQDNEPSSASEGDIWFDTNDGNKQYVYQSGSWVVAQDTEIGQAIQDAANAQATADGKVTTFYQATAPTAEGEGDLWVDTDNGNRLYRWNGASWIDIQDDDIGKAIQDAADAQATADGKIETFFQDNEPSSASEGDIWFDTNDGNKQYVYQSGSWVVAQDTEIGQAIQDAANAQATADGKVTTFYQNSQPTAEGEGDLWVDTDDGNKLYRWNGSSWVVITDDRVEESDKHWNDFGVNYPDPTNIQIKSSNYVPGSSGWAIDSFGNAEFDNGIFRGVGYFNDGVFRGTLFASDIEGDIYERHVWDIQVKQFGMIFNSSTPPFTEVWCEWKVQGVDNMQRYLEVDSFTVDSGQYLLILEDGVEIFRDYLPTAPGADDDLTPPINVPMKMASNDEEVTYQLAIENDGSKLAPGFSSRTIIPIQKVFMAWSKARVTVTDTSPH